MTRTPVRPTYSALCAAVAALCALFSNGAAWADDVASPRSGLPSHPLTPSEARLWTEQGLGGAATHLRAQSDTRQAGGLTRLRVAVILIEFPDAPADHVLHSREHYEQLLFSRGELPTRSAADFLFESSHGRLLLEGEVRGWFTASGEKKAYTGNAGGLGAYPMNSQRLAEEAFTLADPVLNYAHFDNEGPDGVSDSGDDDELVDGFFIVHQGGGREGGSTAPSDFVSVQWWTPTPVFADGVAGRFFTLNPEDGELGTFLHELGHLLGLPDLYDIDGGSFALGSWSMMAAGAVLDEGRTPADFDAWSKAELGFVDVVQVLQNARSLAIPTTAASGTVYRLWPSGGSTEYFLLENRRQAGLDASLPGSGLLIYHVDDRVQQNSDPSHYHVALEQADGLYQLENRYGSPSIGDPGDPFRAGDVFSRWSDPSNEGYDGRDTYVTVFDIRDPAAEGTMTANLYVEPGPIVELSDLLVTEFQGNGDGLLSAGETVGVIPRIGVSRAAAAHLRVALRSLDPRGVMTPVDIPMGEILPGEPVAAPETARVVLSPDLPTDPYGVPLEITLSWDDAPSRVLGAEIGVGTHLGRSDDFEDPAHGWTASSVRPSSFHQWTYGPHYGAGGTAGWKHGFLRGYRRGCDAVLTSPPILLPPGAVLVFEHRVDITQADPQQILAGGVVEISGNGADWRPVTPAGGYTALFTGQNPDWYRRPVYSGLLYNGSFHEERVDLRGLSGSIRVRFRFYSERETTVGTGWSIDNVRVESGTVPVRVLSVVPRVEDGDVVLRWRLAEPLPAALRWLRGDDPATAVPVGDGWTAALAEGEARDPGGAEHLPASYWIEGRERDGTVSRHGPWPVAAGERVFTWRVLGNPGRGAFTFAASAPFPAGTSLHVFDVRGARVRGLPVPAGTLGMSWDGRDDAGRTVRPGVYFARLTGVSAPPLRIVRLP